MLRGLPLVVVCGLAACGSKDAPPLPPGPDAGLEGFQGTDIDCPGDPSCVSPGDGVLHVGAAKQAYTPANFETYTDENGDHEWQNDEPFTDLDGNGKFDGVWLFGGGRAALSVNNDIEARALAFVQGDTTAVVLYIDSVGLIGGDIDLIRAHPLLAELDIDHIIIGTTHAHDTPDTLGLWGPTATSTGRQQFVLDKMYDAAAAVIKDAIETAKPSNLVIASTKLLNDPANPNSLTDDFNKDIRDPIIFDPTLTIARFVDAANPSSTIGTLVNWANHPEASHFSDTDSSQITAHYVHWLRDGIENGVPAAASSYTTTDLPGIGGITVFAQGALGGQIGSLRGTHVKTADGTPTTTLGHAFEQALGTNAAALALQALTTSGESASELPLAVKSAKFNARIDNTYFHVAFIIELLGPHELIGYDPDEAIEEGNLPWMPLRASFLQVGPLGLVTAPGELHPELWVGGYDGSWSHGYQMFDASKPNLPKFDEAPAPPYMRDLVLAHPGVKYPILAGCAEDYVGYIVPAYNYALDPSDPFLVEAEGDHYEEVYSLGPDVEQHVVHPILQLLMHRR
jgi:hypothetical protein